MDSKHRSSNDPSPPPKSLAPSILPSASTPTPTPSLSSVKSLSSFHTALRPRTVTGNRCASPPFSPADGYCMLCCAPIVSNTTTPSRIYDSKTSVGALQPLVDRFTPDQRPEYQSKCAHPDHPRCLLAFGYDHRGLVMEKHVERLTRLLLFYRYRLLFEPIIRGPSWTAMRDESMDACPGLSHDDLTVLYTDYPFLQLRVATDPEYHPPAPYEDDALILHESTILSQYHLGSASPEYCEQLSLTHRSTPARMYQSAYRTDRWISAWLELIAISKIPEEFSWDLSNLPDAAAGAPIHWWEMKSMLDEESRRAGTILTPWYYWIPFRESVFINVCPSSSTFQHVWCPRDILAASTLASLSSATPSVSSMKPPTSPSSSSSSSSSSSWVCMLRTRQFRVKSKPIPQPTTWLDLDGDPDHDSDEEYDLADVLRAPSTHYSTPASSSPSSSLSTSAATSSSIMKS